MATISALVLRLQLVLDPLVDALALLDDLVLVNKYDLLCHLDSPPSNPLAWRHKSQQGLQSLPVQAGRRRPNWQTMVRF